MRRRAWLAEVVNHQLFLETAGCEDLGTWLGGEGYGADNVGMLKGVKAFASMCVPDLSVANDGSARGVAW